VALKAKFTKPVGNSIWGAPVTMDCSGYAFSKRVFDLALGSIGLVCASPVMLLIAVAIKLDSHGPVIYRGVRIGKGARPFFMYKFRTMVVGADRMGTATAHRDPRITRLGALLRRVKLDEFPQIINVLKGEMSLVGPRPEVEEHIVVYHEEERLILAVTPGITDYSSIRFANLSELLGSENPNRVFIEKYRAEKNRLRLEYVRRRSFWTDLKILFGTARRLLVGR
jgi:lipopolysaccharide/colanic/teichoic acid biosynthesis glycosyltransferase